jgi:hypothetical protein
MKRVEIEVTNKETRYKACDGTLFTTETECRKFEETAYCVIKSRLMSIVTSTINPYEKGLCYNEKYSTGYIVVLEDENKVDIVNVYLNFHGNSMIPYSWVSNTIVIMYNEYDNRVWVKNLNRDLDNLKELIDSVNQPF